MQACLAIFNVPLYRCIHCVVLLCHQDLFCRKVGGDHDGGAEVVEYMKEFDERFFSMDSNDKNVTSES